MSQFNSNSSHLLMAIYSFKLPPSSGRKISSPVHRIFAIIMSGVTTTINLISSSISCFHYILIYMYGTHLSLLWFFFSPFCMYIYTYNIELISTTLNTNSAALFLWCFTSGENISTTSERHVYAMLKKIVMFHNSNQMSYSRHMVVSSSTSSSSTSSSSSGSGIWYAKKEPNV